MDKILKIENFVKAFPSKYGLSSDGSYYDIIDDFYAEALIDYEKIEDRGGLVYLKPNWYKFKVKKCDLLISSLGGTYLQPYQYDSVIEVRPTQKSIEGDPSFDRFNLENISKIGKDLTQKKIMDKATRSKLLSTRS